MIKHSTKGLMREGTDRQKEKSFAARVSDFVGKLNEGFDANDYANYGAHSEADFQSTLAVAGKAIRNVPSR